MKKFLTIMMAVVVLLFCKPNYVVNAAENDFGTLIDVNTYEEDGTIIVERIYFKSGDDNGISAHSTSGDGWYTNEKTYTFPEGDVMTYYAQGHFIWGNGDVIVEDKVGGISGQPKNVTLSNKELTWGKAKYGLLSKNCAYVTLSFTASTPVGMSNDYSVTIRVSETGSVV